MFNLLSQQGPHPQYRCHPPSCLRKAGSVAGAAGAAHLSSVFLGIHTSGHACPGQRGEQKEHWIRSPEISHRACPSWTQMIRVPSGSLKPLMPTVEGARTKGEGFERSNHWVDCKLSHELSRPRGSLGPRARAWLGVSDCWGAQ